MKGSLGDASELKPTLMAAVPVCIFFSKSLSLIYILRYGHRSLPTPKTHYLWGEVISMSPSWKNILQQ